MILKMGRAARRLDHWVQHRLGRPYNILLSIGPVTELVERAKELPHALASAPNEVRLVLLLHPVSVLSHNIETHRQARRGGGEG